MDRKNKLKKTIKIRRKTGLNDVEETSLKY